MKANSIMKLTESSRIIEEQFDLFCSASNFSDVLNHFNQLCGTTHLKTTRHPWNVYKELRSQLRHYWKASGLFEKLDKRVQGREYLNQTCCSGMNALVIGCGPCGLRSAIELALLGARVVIIEKRETFSRNNVLHLWPYLIEDLKALGAKTFFGKFCAGSIDHISIRTLQCILLKAALLFGVQVFSGVSYEGLVEPQTAACTEPKDDVILENGVESWSSDVTPKHDGWPKSERARVVVPARQTAPTEPGRNAGWRARLHPDVQVLRNYEFDVVIGADGRQNLLRFPIKELRCRLAIAITANFINYNTQVEADVPEISGMASIFNQQFFAELAATKGIDLENLVYYKDETHYFVMTAKKHSLLAKGVLKRDFMDSESLLNSNNVNSEALQNYVRETAIFATNGRLPYLDFAPIKGNQPDVTIFDFTRMYAAKFSCRMIERRGYLLMQCLVGDCLLEPFWPTGSGCALGFMSCMDAAWAVSRLASGMPPLQVIAQRESIYHRLSQTTPQNMPSNFSEYTIDPNTRYVQCALNLFDPHQVRYLFDTDQPSKPASRGKRVDNVSRLQHPHKRSLPQSWASQPDLVGLDVTRRPINNRFNWGKPPKEGVWQSDEELVDLAWRSGRNSRDSSGLDLLRWFQTRLSFYQAFGIIKPTVDLSPEQWSSGFNLLCLVHLYRPDLVRKLEAFIQNAVNSNPTNATPAENSDLVFGSSTPPAVGPHPKLILACGHLTEHFNVEFTRDGSLSTNTYPRSESDWLIYLMQVYMTLSPLRMAGPPRKVMSQNARLSIAQPKRSVDDSGSFRKSRLRHEPADLQRSPPLRSVYRPVYDSSFDDKVRRLSVYNNGDEVNGFRRAKLLKATDENVVEKGLLNTRRNQLMSALAESVAPKTRASMADSSLIRKACGTDRHSTASLNGTLETSRKEGNSMAPLRSKINSTEVSRHNRDLVTQTIRPVRMPENVAKVNAAAGKCASHCHVCEKRLTAKCQRVVAFDFVFHSECFRCATCRIQLEPSKASHTRITKHGVDGDHKADKFYCQDHVQPRVRAIIKAVEQPSDKRTSLVDRLRAGQFPFGPKPARQTNTLIQRLATNAKKTTSSTTKLSAAAVPQPNRPAQGLASFVRPNNNNNRLALLDKDGFDVLPLSVSERRASLMQRIHSSSTSSSSQSNTNNNSRYQVAGRQLHRTPAKRIGTVGIRDDPAPETDCFLAGHAGLPEVERRANLELNSAPSWPMISIPEMIEQLGSNRTYISSLADDYLASSESELSPPPRRRPQNRSNRVTKRVKKTEKVTSPYASVHTNGCVSPLRIAVPPGRVADLRSPSSSPSLGLINVPHLPDSTRRTVSSGHSYHTDLGAAKQRFCLEPPRPLSIDPRRFIADKNLERTVMSHLSDCQEAVEELSELTELDFTDTPQSDLITICPPRVNIDPCQLIVAEPLSILIYENSQVLPLDDYQPTSPSTMSFFTPPETSTEELRPDKDEEYLENPAPWFESAREWTDVSRAVAATGLPPLAWLDDIRDIDSQSNVTEMSSANDHPLTNSGVPTCRDMDRLDEEEVGASRHETVVSPFSLETSGVRIAVDEGVMAFRRSSISTSSSSSTDLDSAVCIHPARGGHRHVEAVFPAEAMPICHSFYDRFRLRCADRNRRLVNLNRELQTLKQRLSRLDQARYHTEEELKAVDVESAELTPITPDPAAAFFDSSSVVDQQWVESLDLLQRNCELARDFRQRKRLLWERICRLTEIRRRLLDRECKLTSSIRRIHLDDSRDQTDIHQHDLRLVHCLSEPFLHHPEELVVDSENDFSVCLRQSSNPQLSRMTTHPEHYR